MPKELEDFYAKIKDIPDKGFGGCLLFCYAFFMFLRKNKISAKSFKIVQYAHGKSAIISNLKFLNSDANHPVASYHFTFKYLGKEYDCNGIVKGAPNRVVSKTLPIKKFGMMRVFCKTAMLYGNWNKTFNRNKWQPVIEQRLGIKL